MDRGRELLRGVVALVKHANLRDTEFASRLLRVPIDRDKGVPVIYGHQHHFAAGLLESFSYFFPLAGGDREVVRFHPDRKTVCVDERDFFNVFHEQFGVPLRVVLDSNDKSAPLPRAEQAWRQSRPMHPTAARTFFQSMPNGIGVEAVFLECAVQLTLRGYKTSTR